jgi:predicted Holliday junction resolvase-like endonuclease
MDEITLFILIFIMGMIAGGLCIYLIYRVVNKAKLMMWKNQEEKRIRKNTAKAMRGVLKGKISEQVSPVLNDFPGSIADARFLGSPVDFVVFDGYTQNDIKQIVFVEVKTGKKAHLSSVERQVRDCVKLKKVDWKEFYIDS